MMENYQRLYWGTSKREVEAELLRYLDDELHKRYGEQLDETISERVRQEWHAIGVNENFLDVAILHELCSWMRQTGYVYWLTGPTGSSFILYLLGVASVNPLPAHYLCPKCHTVKWNENYKSGFDLPPELGTCDEDGSTMIRDGNDIPWQPLWGYKCSPVFLNIKIDPALRDTLFDFFENHWLRSLEPNNLLSVPYSEHQSLFHFSNISFDVIDETQEVYRGFHQCDIDASTVLAALHHPGFTKAMDLGLTDEHAQSLNFADTVYLFGLQNSDGTWDDESQSLVSNFGYSPSDLIAFRDDVFKYMLDHDYAEKDAWRASEKVRKGMGLPFFREEMTVARDKWVLHRLNSVRYLDSKAHALEYIFFTIKCL